MPDLPIDLIPVLAPESMRDRRSAPSFGKGGILVSDDGKEVQRDMVQCAHCGRVWQWHKGSGKLRSYCSNCNGITCGAFCPMGDACVPMEKGIELMEAGYLFHELPEAAQKSVSVNVPADVPTSPGGVLLGR